LRISPRDTEGKTHEPETLASRHAGGRGLFEITRNDFRTDPPNLIKQLPPQEEIDKWKRAQWQAKYHMQDCLTRQRRKGYELPEV
jgi:hypothetical protein